MKLGILDQVPLPKGASVQAVFDQTIKLAAAAEQMGYSRYWLAEHHNTNGLLSASPEILMTRIGAATTGIRLGSGGILLSQYSPLKVAETFKTMEALFPDRIDLGVGRSPGGTERTRKALTDGSPSSLDEFPRQIDDLIGFLHNELPKNHPYRMVKVTPRPGTPPPVWILSLSPTSAKLAAEKGLGLTFGHFINPDKWELTLKTYRENFNSGLGHEPKVNICVFVVCAETMEKAEELAISQDLWLLGIEKGDSQIPPPEELLNRRITEEERKKIAHNRRRSIIGTPSFIKDKLEELSIRYKTDDFLLITNIHDAEARLHSYELIAQTMDLSNTPET
ncbi:LLM class flavin-dependent oxidoreductase [Jeotgalibacillus sp. S-D1]|uniref:LLM class flavin-dependent oxidoreductase n=1 Tax=Jeotgalibacillus sp. S-D1 TaxID=2552189 RepID=UPI0010592BEB|nr:LLM class flavin-dependent oxidoreductase [Jeotgalibacillus sp. S-D1]TDL31430.1 LLM class flavin-dependent oxidoreductase [Jeotgalibacillus sp. S-D1]